MAEGNLLGKQTGITAPPPPKRSDYGGQRADRPASKTTPASKAHLVREHGLGVATNPQEEAELFARRVPVAEAWPLPLPTAAEHAAQTRDLARLQRQAEDKRRAERQAERERIRAEARDAEPRLREELRELIDAHQVAEGRTHAAREAVARADERLTTLRVQIAQAADLREQVAQWQSEQIKAGRDDDLPDILAGAAMRLREAQARVEQLGAARERLKEEAEQAQAAETVAQAAVAAKAREIVVRRIALVACDYGEAHDRMTELGRELKSAAVRHLSGADNLAGNSKLPQIVVAELHKLAQVQPDVLVQDQLLDWFTRLRSDPWAPYASL